MLRLDRFVKVAVFLFFLIFRFYLVLCRLRRDIASAAWKRRSREREREREKQTGRQTDTERRETNRENYRDERMAEILIMKKAIRERQTDTERRKTNRENYRDYNQGQNQG